MKKRMIISKEIVTFAELIKTINDEKNNINVGHVAEHGFVPIDCR